MGIKIHSVIHMSSGDKMAPFLASEMAWGCHMIFFNYVYIYTNYSTSCTALFVLKWVQFVVHNYAVHS